MTPGWGKIKPAAQYAGVSERTMRKYLHSGLVHSRLPGGSVFIRYSDIDEFLISFQVKENRAEKIAEGILKSE